MRQDKRRRWRCAAHIPALLDVFFKIIDDQDQQLELMQDDESKSPDSQNRFNGAAGRPILKALPAKSC